MDYPDVLMRERSECSIYILGLSKYFLSFVFFVLKLVPTLFGIECLQYTWRVDIKIFTILVDISQISF